MRNEALQIILEKNTIFRSSLYLLSRGMRKLSRDVLEYLQR